MSEDRISDIEGKVGRLEAAVENTQSSIKSLAENTEKQITSLANTTEHQIERLASSINKMSEHQFSSQRTNWSQIWSAAAVVIVLFSSLIGGFVLSPQHKMSNQLESIENVLAKHKSDGHPNTVISRIEEVRNDFNNMRGDLRLEISTINDAHNIRINTLSSILQDTKTEVKSEIDKFNNWKNNWVALSLPARSSLITKVEHLEGIYTEYSDLTKSVQSHEDRLITLEREAFPNAKYRKGKP